MPAKGLNLYFLGSREAKPEDEVVRIKIQEGSQVTEKTFNNWEALKAFIEEKRQLGYIVWIVPYIKRRCGYSTRTLIPTSS